MKLEAALPDDLVVLSLPARGAWVETRDRVDDNRHAAGRSPQGERGLKPVDLGYVAQVGNVAPRKGSVG